MINLQKFEILLLKRHKKLIHWLLVKNIILLIVKEIKKYYIPEVVDVKRLNVIEIIVNVLKLVLVVVMYVNV